MLQLVFEHQQEERKTSLSFQIQRYRQFS